MWCRFRVSLGEKRNARTHGKRVVGTDGKLTELWNAQQTQGNAWETREDERDNAQASNRWSEGTHNECRDNVKENLRENAQGYDSANNRCWPKFGVGQC